MTAAATERTPAVGEQAPDFSLDATSGRKVSLSQYRGDKHVLVAFFPLAFTSTCTTELCDFSAGFDDFERGDTVVLPISVDSVPTLKEFKKQQSLTVELLSDFKREATTAYDVMWRDAFFSNRAYFLVDKQGVVRWAHVEATPSGKRENAEILAEIAKLV